MKNWKEWLKYILIGALGFYLVVQFNLFGIFGSSGGGLVGQTAPDFTLQDYQGNEITLSDLRGKAVLLNFWFPT